MQNHRIQVLSDLLYVTAPHISIATQHSTHVKYIKAAHSYNTCFASQHSCTRISLVSTKNPPTSYDCLLHFTRIPCKIEQTTLTYTSAFKLSTITSQLPYGTLNLWQKLSCIRTQKAHHHSLYKKSYPSQMRALSSSGVCCLTFQLHTVFPSLRTCSPRVLLVESRQLPNTHPPQQSGRFSNNQCTFVMFVRVAIVHQIIPSKKQLCWYCV